MINLFHTFTSTEYTATFEWMSKCFFGPTGVVMTCKRETKGTIFTFVDDAEDKTHKSGVIWIVTVQKWM